MVDYREILRLNSQESTQRQIATSVGRSRNTISEVLETANAKGIKLTLLWAEHNEKCISARKRPS